MNSDIKLYFLFIGLPAALLTLAGLLLLVFGASGLSAEIKSPSYQKQFERYERRAKTRMASRLKAYRKDGRSDYFWAAGTAPIGTNVPYRVKYGLISSTNGAYIGWARLEDGSVIGYNVPPFEYADRRKLYLFGIGVVMVILLFATLSAGGWLLARAARRAREDLELRNSFLDVMSHELNTPLGSIVPLSSALASGGIRDENHRAEAIAVISRESSRMARMIDELLTVVRLRKGKITYSRERFDLRSVAETAADLMRTRHPDCAILVKDGPPVLAMADRDRMEQVAINLIENACRYAGNETVEVACRLTGGGVAVMDVADRGPGIPPSMKKRIFERFYQGDEDGGAASAGGLGLGLSIVAGFMKGMSGSIAVSDRIGGGSVFTAVLPAADAEYGGEGACDG